MTQLNCTGMFSFTYADIDRKQKQTEYSHLRLTEVSTKIIRFKSFSFQGLFFCLFLLPLRGLPL